MSSNLYLNPGSANTFKSSGGTVVWTPTSLASGAGRMSAMLDLGTSPRSKSFGWRLVIKPGATRVVAEAVRIYLITGDGTNYDNSDGTADAAVSALDKLRNVMNIGVTQIDKNAADFMDASGEVELVDRYVAVAIWNATANSLSTTATDFVFTLWPTPIQAQ